jgi:hypothetical protein
MEPFYRIFGAAQGGIRFAVQAILSAKTTPGEAVATAQKNAEGLPRPYVEETALKRLV